MAVNEIVFHVSNAKRELNASVVGSTYAESTVAVWLGATDACACAEHMIQTLLNPSNISYYWLWLLVMAFVQIGEGVASIDIQNHTFSSNVCVR